MNNTEKIYFEALQKDRTAIADMMEKFAVRDLQEIAVNQAADKAQFIYDLIKNADDMFAENAKFILEKDRLIFKHNGLKSFSVTAPENEEKDFADKTLGNVNALTAITKLYPNFQSVFNYTTAPCIYAPNIMFKIERLIVPVLLESDSSERRNDETWFVIPFDKDSAKSYEEISEAFKKFSYQSALSKLKNIEFEYESNNISYEVGDTIKRTGYPDSRLIPAVLRKDSIAVEIIGTRPGKYFLVPYEGKLKNFTDKRPIPMSIPQIRGSKEKMVPVSAFPDDYILYITMENFKRYEDGLLDAEVLELRENAGAVEMFARNNSSN